MSQPPGPQDEQPDPWTAPPAPSYGQAPPPPPAYGQAPPPPAYGQGAPPPAYGQAPPPPPYGQPAGQGYGWAAPSYGEAPGWGDGGRAPGTPGGFGTRFVARLLDGLVGTVLSLVVAVPTGLVSGITAAAGGSSSGYQVGRQAGSTALALVIWGVYEVLLVHHRGQTLGMMALGIKVVDDRSGERPTLGASALRWVVMGASYALCFLPFVLVCLSTLFDSSGHQRGWHDKASSTRVVKA